VVTANDLLQGKPKPAAVDVARFMVNTTFGVAGFFDPATSWGLVRRNEDFGQTLGVWGVGPGPYLVLPLFGPSNVRDTGGLVVDYVLSVYPWAVDSWILLPVGAVSAVNTRAQILQEVEDAKQASLDYYVFVRNAYYQRRIALVNDQQEEQGHRPTESLYDLTGIEDTK
jgi:phospholipid-binding lipoprotein MlaA